MPTLFSPLTLRSLTIRNRIFVSPMCQYSSEDGMPTDWHLVHLGARAVGGAGLVMVEATAVNPEGRISPWDSGLWSAAHAEAFKPITRFIKQAGAVPAVQLAHAGRKASTNRPWINHEYVPPEKGGWLPVAPSPVAFDKKSPTPREMTHADIEGLVDDFAASARWSLEAGFEVVELHAAHGYLAHEFLSPLSNHRSDQYGGSLENRMRLPLRLARTLRKIWPDELPVFVRISATDYAPGGWDLDQSVALCRELKKAGVDFIDCSSGGLVPAAPPKTVPGYQVPYADTIRISTGLATGAVGLITSAEQADAIISSNQADAVLLAREFLRNPYWPLHAAHKLGVQVSWPVQYDRARPR